MPQAHRRILALAFLVPFLQVACDRGLPSLPPRSDGDAAGSGSRAKKGADAGTAAGTNSFASSGDEGAGGLSGFGASASTPVGIGPGEARFTVLPSGSLTAVPAVMRLSFVSHQPEPESPAAYRLYEGELSSYYLGLIKKGASTSKLDARRVDLAGWADTDGRITLAPLAVLTPGQSYSVASSAGLLTTFSVSIEPVRGRWVRAWPPAQQAGASQVAVVCATGVGSPPLSQARLEPGHLLVEVSNQIGSLGLPAGCARVGPAGDLAVGALTLLPLEIAGVPLEPSSLRSDLEELPSRADCLEGEERLQLGCLDVRDDRLLLRASFDAYWLVALQGESEPKVSRSMTLGDTEVLLGLVPESDLTLELAQLTPGGHLVEMSLVRKTRPAEVHVAINEVMAVPRGPQTGQWIELVNHGAKSVDTGALAILVGSERVALPVGELGSGVFAVVVPEGFAGDAEFPIPSGTPLLRVPGFGTRGLPAKGGTLTLVGAGESVLSVFSWPESSAGISWARRHPWDFDGDPAAIARHAAPGASPGVPNLIEAAGVAP